jgi:PAS domain S-box-containing protein
MLDKTHIRSEQAMQDKSKTKAQLLEELEALREHAARLGADLAAHEQAEEQYRNLFKYSGESIMIVDPSTLGFVDVNANAARRLGYDRKEMLDMTLRDVEVHDPDGCADSLSWESGVSGTTFYECRYRRKDGREFPAEVSSRLVGFGERYVLLNFVRDITKRKEMENELRDYQRQLEAQNEELRAFNHTVAHDLRSPLTSIMGFAELLNQRLDTITPDKRREHLQTIIRVAGKMSNIIDELMLLAGVRETEAVPEPLDMGAIVSEALDRLSYEIKHYQAEVVLPDAAAWPTALGYGPWVEEVWVNYLSNACKYGGRPPRIELGGAEASGQACFWVIDNGPGLTPEDQAKLFAPFERLHQVRIQGHGLGLSIVRRIVEKLGGQVGVESEPGKGSTFTFCLPRA